VAAIAGPLLGGVVYDRAGYYAVFAMGFAVIGLDIVLRLIMIEKRRARQWLETENATAVDRSAASDPNQIQTTIEKSSPSDAEHVRQEENLNVNDSALSTRSNTRSRLLRRLPPVVTLLRHSRLLAALFGCFVQAACITAFESVLPLYVKDIFKWSSTGAGLIFICLVVPALLSPLVGHIADLYGSRTITTVGFIGGLPFWVLLRLVHYNSIRQKVLLCALLTLIGTFLTLVGAPLMAEIDHILTMEERLRPGSLGKGGAAAQGFGLFNFAFACGTLVGPLWAGFVVEGAGWGTMGWSLGLLSGVAGVVTFIWIGGRIRLRNRKPEAEVEA